MKHEKKKLKSIKNRIALRVSRIQRNKMLVKEIQTRKTASYNTILKMVAEQPCSPTCVSPVAFPQDIDSHTVEYIIPDFMSEYVLIRGAQRILKMKGNKSARVSVSYRLGRRFLIVST